MPTPFQDIYNKFLHLIDDTELASLDDITLSDLLFNYLNRSTSIEFKQCRKNLNDYNKEVNQFNVELTDEEQWIVALGMVLGYLEPKIKRERLLRDAISDRDYKESSHAEQLMRLTQLESQYREKLKEYIINYTYNDFKGFY